MNSPRANDPTLARLVFEDGRLWEINASGRPLELESVDDSSLGALEASVRRMRELAQSGLARDAARDASRRELLRSVEDVLRVIHEVRPLSEGSPRE